MARHSDYNLLKNWLLDVEHFLISTFACGSEEASDIMSDFESDLTVLFDSGIAAYVAAEKFAPVRSI